jgi:hypothetical protein
MHTHTIVQSSEVHIGHYVRSVVLGASGCVLDAWESAHINIEIHLIRINAHMHTLHGNLVKCILVLI